MAERAAAPAEWMTEAEAAEAMAVSRTTLRKLIAAGELTASNAAPSGSARRLLRIARAELVRFMEARQCPSTNRPDRRRRRRREIPNHLGI